MRRYLVVALPILLLGAALYVIGSAGSPRQAKSTPQLLPPAQQAATTRTQAATVPQTTTVPHDDRRSRRRRSAHDHGHYGQTNQLPLAAIPRRSDRRRPLLRPGKARPSRNREHRADRLQPGVGRHGQPAPAVSDHTGQAADRIPAPREPGHLRAGPGHTGRGRWECHQSPEPLSAAPQWLRRPADPDGGGKPAPRRDLRAQDHDRSGGEDARGRLAIERTPGQ